MKSLRLPESLKTIGEGAFYHCTGLKSVTIPYSVDSIGNFIFRDCSNITKIVVDVNNKVYDSRKKCNGVIHTATNTLIIGFKNTVIPKSVTTIGDWAYLGNSNIKTFVVPKHITKIGTSAFSNCFELTTISIPESVTSIGKGAFRGCNKLTSAELPNSLTSIADETFHSTGLKSCTIPESVTSIGTWTFQNCENLREVTIGSNVKNIGWQAFYGCNHLNVVKNLSSTPQNIMDDTFDDYWELHVPSQYKKAYQEANYWNKFKIMDITAQNSVNDIKNSSK